MELDWKVQELNQPLVKHEKIMDKVLHHFAGENFKDEVAKAKKDFFDNAGILDEHNEHFELRMTQFFDWYYFSRQLTGYAQTPLDSAHLTRELRFAPEEFELIAQQKKHNHSIFEFIKLKGDDVYIKDLLKNEKLVVKSSPWIYGFDSDGLFEARLIPHENSYIFTRGFCFHPLDAKKYILSEVKRHRKDPDLNQEQMMLKLLKMRYRYEQYRHVKAELIYTNEVLK